MSILAWTSGRSSNWSHAALAPPGAHLAMITLADDRIGVGWGDIVGSPGPPTIAVRGRAASFQFGVLGTAMSACSFPRSGSAILGATIASRSLDNRSGQDGQAPCSAARPASWCLLMVLHGSDRHQYLNVYSQRGGAERGFNFSRVALAAIVRRRRLPGHGVLHLCASFPRRSTTG